MSLPFTPDQCFDVFAACNQTLWPFVLAHWLYALAGAGQHSGGSCGSMTDALGLESGIVRLVEYDARWPALFAVEQQRIRDHCGPLALSLEHIGGTSIPGMCAKPVLDLAAGVPRDACTLDYVAALMRAGYEHRGERGVAGRQYFRRGNPRTHHVHMVEEGGSLWRDYVAFRDYLRSHAEGARQFADLKRQLAARFSRDREAYMNAKSEHVQKILRLADGAG